MANFLTETPISHLVRAITRNGLLQFPEEDDNFVVPNFEEQEKSNASHKQSIHFSPDAQQSQTLVTDRRQGLCHDGKLDRPSNHCATATTADRQHCRPITRVEWYGPNDMANPRNWPASKKGFVCLAINYANSAIYMSASVFTAAQSGVMDEFSVSMSVASLGIALFVLGYGIGPLVFSPISDIGRVGRNPPYVVSILIFLVISVLTSACNSIGGLLALRFLQGFFGCPVLSFGGASLGDIYDDMYQPFVLYTWACSGFAATAIGPIISSFAIPTMGWRWALWEIVLMNIPTLIFFILLPETSSRKILYDRAKRLQKRDPEKHYISSLEIKEEQSFSSLIRESLVVPWKIHLLDPSIMFTSLYTGIMYGVYYSFFEVLPLVYTDIYNFTTTQTALIFCSVTASVILAGIPYCAYIYLYLNPRAQENAITPEQRLMPALVSSLLVPIGMFILAWASKASIHWIVPTLGVALTTAGFVIILQSIFVYIAMAYPLYKASVFGGNGFWRSVLACAALVFSRPLYAHLGIAGGTSLMGGLCIIGVVGILVLSIWGKTLRERSSFTSQV